jgi:hypothetical protein
MNSEKIEILENLLETTQESLDAKYPTSERCVKMLEKLREVGERLDALCEYCADDKLVEKLTNRIEKLSNALIICAIEENNLQLYFYQDPLLTGPYLAYLGFGEQKNHIFAEDSIYLLFGQEFKERVINHPLLELNHPAVTSVAILDVFSGMGMTVSNLDAIVQSALYTDSLCNEFNYSPLPEGLEQFLGMQSRDAVIMDVTDKFTDADTGETMNLNRSVEIVPEGEMKENHLKSLHSLAASSGIPAEKLVIDALEHQLENCIAAEDYEEADVMKKKIDLYYMGLPQAPKN